MPEADEVMRQDEETSYRLTMEQGITSRLATLSLSNEHAVECVTRTDGCVVWVDHSCQLATTPRFNAAGLPFVDEVIIAWHNEVTATTHRTPHEQDLIAAAAGMARVQAELDKVTAEEKALLARKSRLLREQRVMRTQRTGAIMAARQSHMSLTDIAARLGMELTAVSNAVTRAKARQT